MEPWNTKSFFRPSAWNALTGGWWLTCSEINLNPRSSLSEKRGELNTCLLPNPSPVLEMYSSLPLTWPVRRFLPVAGWRVSQFSPTGKPQQKQQTLPHTVNAKQITWCRDFSLLFFFLHAVCVLYNIFLCLSLSIYVYQKVAKNKSILQIISLVCTFILSTESEAALAWWMRYVCSMYSVRRCRKLRGSLKITGMVILDSSWERERTRERKRENESTSSCTTWFPSSNH